MSRAAGGDSVEQPLVLLACAIGRLSVDSSTGELDSSSHQLLADSLNEQSVTPAKQARQHLKAILKKGAHKLQPGATSHTSPHRTAPHTAHCTTTLPPAASAHISRTASTTDGLTD